MSRPAPLVRPTPEALTADAAFLNPACSQGRGAERWARFLTSEVATQRGLTDLKPFALAGRPQRWEVAERLERWTVHQLRSGARNLVAAGGDGTVNLFANAVVNASRAVGLPSDAVRLGAVGLGSSNDFHKPTRTEVAGVPYRLDFEHAAPRDLGRMHTESGITLFAVGVSVGTTALANETLHGSKGMLGYLKGVQVDTAFVLAGLHTLWGWRNFPASITADGVALECTRFANLNVVKSPWLGAGMRFDHDTPPNTGTLGLHLCTDMSRARLLHALWALHGGAFTDVPGTQSTDASHVVIRLDQARLVEVDGETHHGRTLTLDVVPNAILVCP